MYYHTQNNRRVRRIDLKRIEFARGRELLRSPLDKEKGQDYEHILVRK